MRRKADEVAPERSDHIGFLQGFGKGRAVFARETGRDCCRTLGRIRWPEDFCAQRAQALNQVTGHHPVMVRNALNPQMLEGQLYGGIAQGIGEALMEQLYYDEAGQLLTGSLMDYALPRADDLPMFAVDHSSQTPCTHNPLGVKGCGEAGAIGAPPAVVNAVIDALWKGGYKVKDVKMPLTPERVWQAMQS